MPIRSRRRRRRQRRRRQRRRRCRCPMPKICNLDRDRVYTRPPKQTSIIIRLKTHFQMKDVVTRESLQLFENFDL